MAQPAENVMATLPNTVKLPKLQKVDGKDERQLRRFFRRVEGYLAAYQLSPEDHRSLFFVAQHFTGALEDWWENRQKTSGDNIKAGFSSFQELRDHVFQEFQGRDPADEARANLDNARQRGTVKEYANFIRQQLLYLPNRDDADNLHTFRRGLKHEIDASLAMRRPATFAEAVEAALEVEASLQQRMGDTRYARLNYVARRTAEVPGRGDSSSDSSEDEDELEDEESLNMISSSRGRHGDAREKRLKKLQASGKCFFCEGKGHLARDCPKKRIKKRSGPRDTTRNEDKNSEGEE